MLKICGSIARPFLGILFSCLLLLTSSAAAQENWDFIIAPYIQPPFISGEATLGRIEGVDLEVTPSDILDAFSRGGMLQVEAHHGSGFGLVLNYGFMKLKDSVSGPAQRIDIAGDISQAVMEGFLSYREKTADYTLDLYAGARWWDIEVKFSASSQIDELEVKREASWIDPVVGLRFIPILSDNWKLLLQGDIGGFNVSSDSSYSASAGLIWDIADSTAISLLYKALWVDYERGEPGTAQRFVYDTVTHGPILGVIFKF